MRSEQIRLYGVNHKTTPLAVREQLAVSGGYGEPLARLAGLPGCREAYLLSTCNRVEVLVVMEPEADPDQVVPAFLFGSAVQPVDYPKYLYSYQGQEAIHHLFMVAASLDSMIVGEAQILGQIKEAYRHAAADGVTGPVLNKLLHKSFSVAKRVRTETRIGSAAVSISYAAVELARKIFGDLRDKKVLLVGAGEMAELAAEHLVGQGVAEVTVANRTLANGVALAKRFQGRAVALDELLVELERADIVISSTGARGVILERDQLGPIMRARRNRPIFFIDIAVPRDLDPAINELDNIYLYDIDDLTNVVEMNKSEREREAISARRIVDEEALKFEGWLRGLALGPTIAALRSKGDAICRAELERTLPRLGELSAGQRKALDKMCGAICSRLLHDPLLYLKEEAHREQTEARVRTVRALFGLKEE